MLYSLTSWLSTNQTTTINKHLYFRALYKPNLIFIPHYVPLHKHTFQTYHLHWNHTNFYSELELCDKTYFVATIKYLLSNFDDNLKEYMKETIIYQDAKFDAKSEKQLQTLSLRTKENYTKFSLKLDDQDKNIYSFTASCNERLENMSINKKVITKIEIAKTEIEATMNMIINGFKYEIGSYTYMKLSPLSSNKSSLSHYQPSAYIIKW